MVTVVVSQPEGRGSNPPTACQRPGNPLFGRDPVLENDVHPGFIDKGIKR